MRPTLLAAAFLAPMVVSIGHAQPDCLPLSDAIRLSLEFDPRIDGSEADRDIARAGLLGATSRNLPQLSAFGQTGLGNTQPLDRARDDQAGFQINQELYSFGARRFATEAARARYEAARHAVSETTNDVAQGVALAFLDYQRAIAALDLAEQQEAAFAQDAQSAASRLERRIITLTDASQIRARHARARSDSINARVSLEAAKSRLGVLINQPVTCIDDASTAAFLSPAAGRLLSLPPEAAVDEAFARSASIRRMRAEINAANASVGEANRANLPVFSANAFALWEFTEDPFFNEDIVEFESRVGFSVSQELFTGGRTEAQRRDARARLRGAHADEDFQRLVLSDLVLRSLAQAKAQQDAGLALLEAREQSRIQLDNTQREYERGTKTLTDLVLANESFFTAASQETDARFQFYSSLVRLYSAMGLLTDSAGL